MALLMNTLEENKNDKLISSMDKEYLTENILPWDEKIPENTEEIVRDVEDIQKKAEKIKDTLKGNNPVTYPGLGAALKENNNNLSLAQYNARNKTSDTIEKNISKDKKVLDELYTNGGVFVDFREKSFME